MAQINKIIGEDLDDIIQSLSLWDSFRNKTVLISGANGFLPAYMVDTLLQLNHSFKNFNVKVIGLVRTLDKAKKRFVCHADNPSLHLVEHDVCRFFETPDHIDFIIHAASQASPKYYHTDPVGTLNANILGTHNLIQLAHQKKVESFLFFSSGEIYGTFSDNSIAIKEDSYGMVDPVNVRNCYAESKRMGENVCVSWLHQFGVKSKIVRPFHTYGPGMDLTDGRVFADFVNNILKGENILLRSDGSARRAFCYLADAIKAFFLVLLKGVDGEAYNVGNPDEEYSMKELAEILLLLEPEKNLEAKFSNALFASNQVSRIIPSVKKLESLGWHAKISAREGFGRTIESFKM